MLRKLSVLLLGVMLLGFGGLASASSGFSLSLGTDDFYMSVGNYDYLPYTLPYSYRTPRISFHNVMSDYGAWVTVAPFGQVWRPYVHHGWRPFTQGHWNYTSYGPTWTGYEPWAWVGYHYGNWIWSSRFGWVWIPGYDWHPGRVIWSHGYDNIGWMPAPPHGYDYSRGYLDYRGSHNQFDYYDNDFDDYYDDDYYDDDYYGDPYNSGYGDLFYGSGYRNIVVNLWIFIDTRHYGYSNYSDCYLDSDYTRALFDRRRVRISSRPLQRTTLERIVKRRINETPVQVREIETNNRRVKVVVPSGEEENIRRNANRVVKNVIAPAFAEKKRNFKGLQAENAPVVNKVFKQENKQPKIKKLTEEEVVRDAINQQKNVEHQRKNFVREKTEKVIRTNPPETEKKRETKVEHKEKDVPFGIGRNRNTEDRDSQLKSVPVKKERESDAVLKQQKNREIEFKMKQDRQKRDAEFEAKQNQQKERRKFEAAPIPQERKRGFERMKPVEKKKDMDFERPNIDSGKSKQRDRVIQEQPEPLQRTRPEPAVEKHYGKKQDQESERKKISPRENQEEVTSKEQNDEERKPKKQKKEDSKRKKHNQD
ncbi:hypothetical protein L0156_17655 [bacterium]|nr:hypothetical protein [bacterium]